MNFYSLGKYDARILSETQSYDSPERSLENSFGANVGRHIAFDNIFNLKIGVGIIL